MDLLVLFEEGSVCAHTNTPTHKYIGPHVLSVLAVRMRILHPRNWIFKKANVWAKNQGSEATQLLLCMTTIFEATAAYIFKHPIIQEIALWLISFWSWHFFHWKKSPQFACLKEKDSQVELNTLKITMCPWHLQGKKRRQVRDRISRFQVLEIIFKYALHDLF